ncbi:unnamed protein product [Diamesa hyperborea]
MDKIESENFDNVSILPAEIKSFIFKDFVSRDVLDLSLVSKSWYNSLGKIPECMDKIWLKFYSFRIKNIESLQLTTRNYEKLKVNLLRTEKEFQTVSDLQICWKKVLIYNSEFASKEIYNQFIQSLAESVVELEISDVKIKANSVIDVDFEFPMLKRLFFRNDPSTALEVFLGKTTSLESLSFDIIQEVPETSMTMNTVIMEFLKLNNKLTHLQLGPNMIKSIFAQDDIKDDLKFQLKTLLLKFPMVGNLPEEMQENIKSFILSQTNLEWIFLWELKDEEILIKLWNELPNLKRVTFSKLEILFEDPMMLIINPNENIIQLDLHCKLLPLNQLKRILGPNVAPNLATLYLQKLEIPEMEYIARTLHNLRTLEYEFIDEDVEDFYTNLKKSTDEIINRDIAIKRRIIFDELVAPFALMPLFWKN